ncbi:MAG: glycosyltransferase family 9 protein [bacterium]|nr:glycosyltransferase family 9 protein [bacterium]
MFLHLDCRLYRGDRPCAWHRLCEACPHYEPMGPRVLIIKLGALGDVVRTACLLPGLAARPEPPHVTWLTSPAARPLVERMPGVHRVLDFTPETFAHLRVEAFDTVLSLDKEPAPCAVAMEVTAERRLGIGLSRYGTPYPLNDECDYYFRLGLDDEEKFHRNTKSYPTLIYEALAMPYAGQTYTLALTDEDRALAAAQWQAIGAPADAPCIGLNPGAGNVFANKAWREEGYVELVRTLGRLRPDAFFLLLGGPGEEGLLERIDRAAGDRPARVWRADARLPLGTFAALVERCAVLVTGDTLAMHLAIALRRRVVALFGPTCAQEIDLFGRGTKIISPADCAPCYRRACDRSPSCQDLIAGETVTEAVLEQLSAGCRSVE